MALRVPASSRASRARKEVCLIDSIHALTDSVLLASGSVDVWASGCVIAQSLVLSPLLPGESDIDQLLKVHQDTRII